MKSITAPQIWEEIFVPQLHKKYIVEVASVWKFENLIQSEGGEIHLDHCATRTPDPKLHEFITRLANAFGLKVSGHYEFPNKKLKAVALQFPDKEGFKWFSTLIEYTQFSREAIKAVEEDLERTKNMLSGDGLELLAKLEKDKSLGESEANSFVIDIVWNFFERQGRPVKKNSIDILGEESSEIVNALLLGPDFNHIGYDLNKLHIKDWYGQEIIEVLYDRMVLEGFEMIPEIQGAQGGLLRQTSTKADVIPFEVEENNGSISIITLPSKFIELIQRGAERDENKKIKFNRDKKITRFKGFIAGNTEKLYDATKL